jgi:hypothetical protein
MAVGGYVNLRQRGKKASISENAIQALRGAMMVLSYKIRLMTTMSAAAVLFVSFGAIQAADDDLIPRQFPKEQRENLQRFLKDHAKPERFVPKDAKLVDPLPNVADAKIVATPEKPIKQYIVQITPYRPVPDQEEVKRADVYYYRPNPEKGKPGITVKRTVDLTSGQQVGEAEVLVKYHTPLSREELAEAVALAREKSPAVQALYKDRDPKTVRWEYLQLMVNRKNAQNEPGDRVVRFVFTAAAANDKDEPERVAVFVNLTKEAVTSGERP